MKKLLTAVIVNLSGLIIACLGIILHILGDASVEGFGTAVIIVGAVIWLVGIVLFVLFKDKNS